ncbi:MAG: hypothetical protein AAGD38_09315 [Acidobacteriota bacterium]
MDQSHDLLVRVATLFERSRSIKFVVPEDTGWFALEDEMIGQVAGLVDDAIDLLREIEHYYDAKPPAADDVTVDGETDFLREIGAQISTELASREVADVAFVSRNQLVEAQEALGRSNTQRSLWKIASHIDTSLRRAGKGMIAVESAMREFEGMPPIKRLWEHLDDSLEIRRTYGLFRRAILRGGDPAGTDLRAQLTNAAKRIATLRDMRIYPYLRIDDRLQIRQLQKRILRWMADTDGAGDHEEGGRRLWADLVGFSRLLTQINNREVLREHDRRVITEIVHTLYQRRPAPRSMPPQVLASLEPLLGRDEELDLLLMRAHDHGPDDWRGPLLRIQRELEKTPAAAGLNEPPF